MLRIELNNLVKFYQDKQILKIDHLKIYDSEKIGIVGLNGCGKTTLLNIISGNIKPDEGFVKIKGSISYITQFDYVESEIREADSLFIKRFGLQDGCSKHMSGGETTRHKIATAFSQNSDILFADEPTSNLDLAGTQIFEEMLNEFPGTVLLVSHDRELLDRVCTKMIEIDDGQVKLYTGNYSEYSKQKEEEKKRKQFEYEQFIKEKSRLERALLGKKQKSKSVKKTPKRMGNSEARLHKMGNQKAKMNLDKSANAILSRINKLEKKESLKDIEIMKLDLCSFEKVYSKVIIEGKNLCKRYGDKIIFNDAEFLIKNGDKTAIIGENGSGKTTLIKMVVEGESGIKVLDNLTIGYFSQDMSILDENKTIIENVIENSVYDETLIRTLLARLLFKQTDIYKKVSVLSGGEKVKASFGKILTSGFNVLILDEPTNYLDVYSMEAVENVLRDYQGNILFVSHDRKFVNKIATNILLIKDKKLISFPGNYDEYLSFEKERGKSLLKERKMLLENRLAELIGRLSSPSKNDNMEVLDREYKEILLKLKEIDCRR